MRPDNLNTSILPKYSYILYILQLVIQLFLLSGFEWLVKIYHFLKAGMKVISDNYILPFSSLFSLPFCYHWSAFFFFFIYWLGILKFFLFILSLAIWNSLYTSIVFCMLFLYILPLLYDLGFFVLLVLGFCRITFWQPVIEGFQVQWAPLSVIWYNLFV